MVKLPEEAATFVRFPCFLISGVCRSIETCCGYESDDPVCGMVHSVCAVLAAGFIGADSFSNRLDFVAAFSPGRDRGGSGDRIGSRGSFPAGTITLEKACVFAAMNGLPEFARAVIEA
jgi:hypothetical protein